MGKPILTPTVDTNALDLVDRAFTVAVVPSLGLHHDAVGIGAAADPLMHAFFREHRQGFRPRLGVCGNRHLLLADDNRLGSHV